MEYSWLPVKKKLHAVPLPLRVREGQYYFAICGVRISILNAMQYVSDDMVSPCADCTSRQVE